MSTKHSGLGRGLGALIKTEPTPAAKPVSVAPVAPAVAPVVKGSVVRVPVEKVHKSPWQPRKEMLPEALDELTHSVREHGVLQPLLVRQVKDTYELIAGERRLRAAQNAELKDVPVIIMEATDKEALELALIENLQRQDLNVIEEAEGYRVLGDKFEMTQEQIAQRVGKARATVANAMRLLVLPDRVKRLVAENQLTPGHAKVLLSLEIAQEQELLAARIIAEGLSVRTLERVIARLKQPPRKHRAEKSDIPEGHVKFLEDRLHQHLGTSVKIIPCRTLTNGKKVKGTLEVDFYSNDDLDRVLVLLGITDNL